MTIVDRFKGPQLRDTQGMYENRALDRMFERQEWICRVQNDRIVDGAYYSPARDMVIIPMKEQFNIGKNAEEIFKDGMEYYSSALHEMTHSTGTANRLNCDKGAKFGDAKYAKEELVAELTAAMVGNTLGFDKRILNNNAAYMDGWINALREEPKFIVSVMADVNKASKMILEKIDEQNNVRCDKNFVEDAHWHQQAHRYEAFVEQASIHRLLLLEFGVDFNTPVIIRFPFERMVAQYSFHGPPSSASTVTIHICRILMFTALSRSQRTYTLFPSL